MGIGDFMTIKIADLNDIENLFELNKLMGNETLKEEMEKNIKINDREIICIAYIGNIAVGYCTGLIIKSICYKNSRLDIESLYVKEEYRKKGIGEALIKFLEKEAKIKNILHFHIITDNNNGKAISLYKKLGYNITGEIFLDKTIIK